MITHRPMTQENRIRTHILMQPEISVFSTWVISRYGFSGAYFRPVDLFFLELLGLLPSEMPSHKHEPKQIWNTTNQILNIHRTEEIIRHYHQQSEIVSPINDHVSSSESTTTEVSALSEKNSFLVENTHSQKQNRSYLSKTVNTHFEYPNLEFSNRSLYTSASLSIPVLHLQGLKTLIDKQSSGVLFTHQQKALLMHYINTDQDFSSKMTLFNVLSSPERLQVSASNIDWTTTDYGYAKLYYKVSYKKMIEALVSRKTSAFEMHNQVSKQAHLSNTATFNTAFSTDLHFSNVYFENALRILNSTDTHFTQSPFTSVFTAHRDKTLLMYLERVQAQNTVENRHQLKSREDGQVQNEVTYARVLQDNSLNRRIRRTGNHEIASQENSSFIKTSVNLPQTYGSLSFSNFALYAQAYKHVLSTQKSVSNEIVNNDSISSDFAPAILYLKTLEKTKRQSSEHIEHFINDFVSDFIASEVTSALSQMTNQALYYHLGQKYDSTLAYKENLGPHTKHTEASDPSDRFSLSDQSTTDFKEFFSSAFTDLYLNFISNLKRSNIKNSNYEKSTLKTSQLKLDELNIFQQHFIDEILNHSQTDLTVFSRNTVLEILRREQVYTDMTHASMRPSHMLAGTALNPITKTKTETESAISRQIDDDGNQRQISTPLLQSNASLQSKAFVKANVFPHSNSILHTLSKLNLSKPAYLNNRPDLAKPVHLALSPAYAQYYNADYMQVSRNKTEHLIHEAIQKLHLDKPQNLTRLSNQQSNKRVQTSRQSKVKYNSLNHNKDLLSVLAMHQNMLNRQPKNGSLENQVDPLRLNHSRLNHRANALNLSMNEDHVRISLLSESLTNSHLQNLKAPKLKTSNLNPFSNVFEFNEWIKSRLWHWIHFQRTIAFTKMENSLLKTAGPPSNDLDFHQLYDSSIRLDNIFNTSSALAQLSGISSDLFEHSIKSMLNDILSDSAIRTFVSRENNHANRRIQQISHLVQNTLKRVNELNADPRFSKMIEATAIVESERRNNSKTRIEWETATESETLTYSKTRLESKNTIESETTLESKNTTEFENTIKTENFEEDLMRRIRILYKSQRYALEFIQNLEIGRPTNKMTTGNVLRENPEYGLSDSRTLPAIGTSQWDPIIAKSTQPLKQSFKDNGLGQTNTHQTSPIEHLESTQRHKQTFEKIRLETQTLRNMLSKHRDTKKQTDTKQVAASPPRPNLPSEKEITRPDRTARELSLRNKTIQDQTFNVHNTNTHLMYKSLVDLVAKDIEAVKTQGKISKTLSFEDQLNGNKTLDNRVLYTSFNTSFDTFLNAQTLEHHDIHHINRSFIESFYQFKGKSSVTEKSEGTLFELSMQVARKSNTLSQFIHQTHHSEMNRTFNQVLSRTLKTLKSLHIETSTDSFTPQESVLSKQKSGPTTLKRDTNSPDTHLRPQYLKNKVDTSHAELDHERTQASTPEARQMQVLRQFKKISKEMSMTGRKHTKTQFSHTLFNTYDPSQVQNEQVNRTITRFNNISQLTQTALSEIENKNIRPVQKDYASQAQMLARKMDEKPRERPMESIEINPEPFVEKTAIESMSASTIQPVQEAMDGVDVDAIFEKIYQKFEKRISFEKRRRGL